MKQALLAATVLGLVCLGAPVANAANPIVWQGVATLTSVPAACTTATGHRAGDSAFSVFRPRLSAAQPNSAITMTFTRSAHAYFRSGGTSTDQMNGTSTYTSPWYSGRATSTVGGNTGNITLALSVSPVLAGTDVVTIVGSITNFHDLASCTVGFNGAYKRRP